MMIARYRKFRKFGHGRFVSVLHAPTVLQVCVGACVAGLVLSFFL